jgi:hypothetical protein
VLIIKNATANGTGGKLCRRLLRQDSNIWLLAQNFAAKAAAAFGTFQISTFLKRRPPKSGNKSVTQNNES